VYSLRAEITRIGRQPDCDVFLDSKDVSRYHAQIVRESGRFMIEDLRSRNGTQVNGQILTGALALEDGDEITISSLRFAFLTQKALLHDSSSSGYAPTVITLSSGSLSGVSDNIPLVVNPGDRIPAEAFGFCNLNSSAIVSRTSVGQPDGGWPTLKQPEHKLLQALQLHHRLRGKILEHDVVLSVLEGLFEAFDAAERIAVILRSPDGNGFVVAAASSRNAPGEIRISIPLLYSVMQSGGSVLHVEREPASVTAKRPPNDLLVRYLLGSTLIDGDRTARGAIQLETRRSGGFEPLDAECLAILSHVISCRLDDCAAADLVTRNTLLHRSIESADHLRRQLTPVKLLRVQEFQVRHQMLTVPEIAADLVDYVRLNDGRLACFILDVPGRGPLAVGLMAAIGHVVTRALVASESPAESIRIVEEDLRTRMAEFPMITSLCAAILDPTRSTVTVSAAGQCPAFHFREGTVEPVTAEAMAGPPLGAPRETCQDCEIFLAPDDVLLLCSDGIARIPAEDGMLATPIEIRRLLERADCDARTGLEDRVIQEIVERQGRSTLQDDIALLAIHRSEATLLNSDVGPVRDTQVQR
jgi:hypothetical protein